MPEPPEAEPKAPEPEPETQSALVESEGRRLAGLIFAVVAPVTLLTALAYYFGYRREEAFAGYFGIDPSTLGFTTNDYILRSVDALFVPVTVVLLVAFGAVLLHALAGDRFDRINLAPVAVVVGVFVLILGIALLAGKPFAHDFSYLQALGPAIGVTLLLYALGRNRSVSRHALGAAVLVGLAVVVVSLFWATAEYADTRGRDEAKRLARDIAVDPSVTIFSKENLDIDPYAPGAGLQQPVPKAAKGPDGCSVIKVHRHATGAFPFAYSGFTLLLESGGNLFVTPGGAKWMPRLDDVFVIPDDGNIRIELSRGADYAVNPGEQTASGGSLPFTC